MGNKYQDVFYIDGATLVIPVRSPRFEKVVWIVRKVHIINISFGDKDIVILYRDIKNEYHKKILKKKPFHKLLIE